MDTRLSLFLRFLKLGVFTIGGGYAMVPLIEREVVDDSHWLERDEYYKLILLTQSVPGPIAVNTALVVGTRVAGAIGGLLSALGVILPSFTILLIIAMNFASFHSLPVVEAIFRGIRATVVALIAAAAVRIARERPDLAAILRTVLLAGAGFVALAFLDVNPFVLVLVFVALGVGKAVLSHVRTKGHEK